VFVGLSLTPRFSGFVRVQKPLKRFALTSSRQITNRPKSIVGHPSRDRQGAESAMQQRTDGIPLPDGRGSDRHWSV